MRGFSAKFVSKKISDEGGENEMKRRDDYGRRGRGVRPVKPFLAVTRGALKGLFGKPWRALLSGVVIAMGLILFTKVFILSVIILLVVLVAADICSR